MKIKAMTRLCRRLRDEEGVSTIEFAFILPIFITLGLAGTELALMSTVNMQVSQAAISLADNASRLGQTDNSAVTPTVTEADIDAVMSGAIRQGEPFELGTKGRVILSSLEYDDLTGKQYIRWQRCRGDLDRESLYGNEDELNGLGSTTIAGVGQAGSLIQARQDSALMVAEIYYEYEGIVAGSAIDKRVFREEAIFAIRDDRNLGPGVTGSGGDSSCSD